MGNKKIFAFLAWPWLVIVKHGRWAAAWLEAAGKEEPAISSREEVDDGEGGQEVESLHQERPTSTWSQDGPTLEELSSGLLRDMDDR